MTVNSISFLLYIFPSDSILFSLPFRVPLGFVCGYPVGIGGELYGGSMFIKSAANDTHQGKAIQAINEKWGEGRWCGRETIGIQVCKKKYAPFNFTVETNDTDGRKIVKVVRMFGCPHHSSIRKERIEKFGERQGWEPFGQWSLRKAQELAKRETNKLNGVGLPAITSDEEYSAASATSDEEIRTMCHNGNCMWKMREKYDNVCHEIRGNSDDEL
jgi:hypothetical protein